MQASPYHQHLTQSEDLITTYAAVRAGFVALALEKNRQATPYVAQARTLKSAASLVATPAALLSLHGIQAALLTAAGISDKAANHLQPQDKVDAIQGLIRNFLEPAGPDFVEELVFRFLLTRGDTLGGSMRNIGGVLAQRRLTRELISTLALAGTAYQWLDARSRAWLPGRPDDADVEQHLRGLSWQRGSESRTIVYNVKVPLVKNNVDVCILHCSPADVVTAIASPPLYLALGELKGGIDPAGADEHWKTARTALSRIQAAFATMQLAPQTFFIGAAIEKRMAHEIWEQLKAGSLANAANLTNAVQLASITRWLCSL